MNGDASAMTRNPFLPAPFYLPIGPGAGSYRQSLIVPVPNSAYRISDDRRA
jgi:hypothetical protein